MTLFVLQPRTAPPLTPGGSGASPLHLEGLVARGGETPVLGESVDFSVWVDDTPGRPILSGDTLRVGTRVAVEWTNPHREGKAWTHLTLVVRVGGTWKLLERLPIGAVTADGEGPVAGPLVLGDMAGAVEVCGVFSAGEATGPSLCTPLKLEAVP